VASLTRENASSRCKNPLARSIEGKFSSADIRTLSFALNEREVRFYQEVAPHVGLRTPRLYHGALDPDTGKSVLLLEVCVVSIGALTAHFRRCNVAVASEKN